MVDLSSFICRIFQTLYFEAQLPFQCHNHFIIVTIFRVLFQKTKIRKVFNND